MILSRISIPLLLLSISCAGHPNGSAGDCPILVAHARQIMAKFDADHDGRISWNEWTKNSGDLRNFSSRESSSNGDDQGIPQYFNDGDLNADGYIELWEIARYPSRDPLAAKSCLRAGKFHVQIPPAS